MLVAPGRSRATSSVVALRLLARIAEEAGRALAVVGDALTRSLAAEAGLDAYASVEDARLALPAPAEAAQARRASIHVVRGDAPAAMETVALAAIATSAGCGSRHRDARGAGGAEPTNRFRTGRSRRAIPAGAAARWPGSAPRRRGRARRDRAPSGHRHDRARQRAAWPGRLRDPDRGSRPAARHGGGNRPGGGDGDVSDPGGGDRRGRLSQLQLVRCGGRRRDPRRGRRRGRRPGVRDDRKRHRASRAAHG